ncbi:MULTISPECIES: signal peptidase I [unclassified Nocardioides]|uniref:signal peptidase I n=1 Tax=unclassified Nocardioides TaxID=2615069 RepID=UPI000AB4FD4E|nr:MULTISPECIES: signal peptidase I [unclassified Nocardioides]
MRKSLGWIGQVVSWLVILGVVAVLAVAVLVPRLAGAAPYTVLTGSMKPNYPPGTLVVVRPVPFDEIAVGDVITYQLESGKATVVTHRVTRVSARLDGEKVLTTQGDANNSPDPEGVEEVQVRGRLWYSVPFLGRVNNALNGGQRQIAVLIVSAGLVGYAAFMFVGSFRDRRRKKTQVVDEVAEAQIHRVTEQVETHGKGGQARDGSSNARVAAAGIFGLVALGLAYRLIRARRGRTTDHTHH